MLPKTSKPSSFCASPNNGTKAESSAQERSILPQADRLSTEPGSNRENPKGAIATWPGTKSLFLWFILQRTTSINKTFATEGMREWYY
jgi:hypothetical protein